MKITITPQRRNDSLTVVRAGDTIEINGEVFDFGPLLDGNTLPKSAVNCDWIASDVSRISGKIHLALVAPHGPITPDWAMSIVTIDVDQDGVIPMPKYDGSASE